MSNWIDNNGGWALTGPDGASVFVLDLGDGEVFWEGYDTDINNPDAGGDVARTTPLQNR